jgi:D-alanyl-D-alanine dipeptidase
VFTQIRPDSFFSRTILCCALALAIAQGKSAARRSSATSPFANSTQLIVVTTADWDAVDGKLQRFERPSEEADWRPLGASIPVVVGKKGTGWGIGLAGLPPHDSGDPIKKEGDRKSPAGIFELGTAFGFASKQSTQWKVPYLALTPSVECVDDSHSRSYNRIVDRSTLTPDWSSSERMLSVGEYYRWGIEIEQNPGAKPQAGSCVFLHIWGGEGGGTEGCTAMAKPNIESILEWLQPASKPLLVQMPLPQYRQVEKALHLPSE